MRHIGLEWWGWAGNGAKRLVKGLEWVIPGAVESWNAAPGRAGSPVEHLRLRAAGAEASSPAVWPSPRRRCSRWPTGTSARRDGQGVAGGFAAGVAGGFAAGLADGFAGGFAAGFTAMVRLHRVRPGRAGSATGRRVLTPLSWKGRGVPASSSPSRAGWRPVRRCRRGSPASRRRRSAQWTARDDERRCCRAGFGRGHRDDRAAAESAAPDAAGRGGGRDQAAVVMTLLTGRAELAGTRDSPRGSSRSFPRDYYRQPRAPIRCFRSSDPLS
jgi:hypothetical protein